MRWLVVGILLPVAACSSAGEKAEQSYGIAKSSGNAADRCRAAQGVANAYLKDADQSGYAKWRGIVDDDCRSARMLEGSALGDLTPSERMMSDAVENEAETDALLDELNRVDAP